MNIFAIDSDPLIAVRSLHNKHIVKMILESAQMLSTVRQSYKIKDPWTLKPTHQKHPSTLWTGESLENYYWLVKHFKAMCEEYTYRYYKVHKLHNMLLVFTERTECIPSLGLTPFALAMPDIYKVEDPIQSYRNYYIGEKIQGNYWTNRSASELPDWLIEHLNPFQFKLNRGETIKYNLVLEN